MKNDLRLRNQQMLLKEQNFIRSLSNFDLGMLVSEIHDHGWKVARVTLACMPGAKRSGLDPKQAHLGYPDMPASERLDYEKEARADVVAKSLQKTNQEEH
jgi:hypothetical protein